MLPYFINSTKHFSDNNWFGWETKPQWNKPKYLEKKQEVQKIK